MSLLKTALACVLLAVLAPAARAQFSRPANSQTLGQATRFGGSQSAARATPVSAQAGPAMPQETVYDAPESDSGGEAWASDAPSSNSPDTLQSPETLSPQYNSPIYDPPTAGGSNSAAASGGGSCQGYCSDSSTGPASAWLGTYCFAGGNPAFNGPWYISADAFLMHRSNGNANIPITVDGNTGNNILSAQNLTFTSKVGPRLMLGYAWSHTTAFEISYFGLIDSRTQVFMSGNNNLTLPGDLSSSATGFNDANQVGVYYQSRLNNAEFNVLRNTGSNSISWLYGFRYLGLQEHFDINSVGTSTADYAIHTRNNMFGVQGGMRWMFNYKNFSVEGTGKLGILENATMQTQSVTDPGAPFLPRSAMDKGANVSFLGEFGANMIYRLSEKWGLRFGYTFIWVDGLALAPNQVDTTYTTTSGTGLNHGGNVFLSAINLGAELHW